MAKTVKGKEVNELIALVSVGLNEKGINKQFIIGHTNNPDYKCVGLVSKITKEIMNWAYSMS